jgi:hypothetical protein
LKIILKYINDYFKQINVYIILSQAFAMLIL